MKQEQNHRTNRLLAGLVCLMLAGCDNLFDLLEIGQPGTKGGLVTISIGNGDNTVQPPATALAGYRLTFTDGPAHDPVDITSGYSASVTLLDGTYTIKAMAYKSGGSIGDAGNAVAEGDISVTLSGGVVTSNGGAVPPIVLGPITGADGNLEYTISTTEAASGTMTLWEIDGETLVSDFGTAGVLTINSSNPVSIPAATVTLPAGRYITEIRLINESGAVARFREVTEIWPGLTTRIVFEPVATDYVDPSAALDLAASTIGGMAVSAGTGVGGSGASEADAVTYLLNIGDAITNAAINLVPTDASLSAAVSWVNNSGTAPGDVYPNTGTTAAGIDFSTNNVLWVRVVSEDETATMYYRFALDNEDLILEGNGSYECEGDDPLKTLTITSGGDYTISMKDASATTGMHIIVASGVIANITLNAVNIDMDGKNVSAFEIESGATVYLTLEGENSLKGGSQKAALAAPAGTVLTITEASTGSMEATGGSGGAGIGGGYKGSGGTITISGGTVNAMGGNGGAGIGGGTQGSGGTIEISGGTVNATGGSKGAGIGGGAMSGGGIIAISGGLINATGGSGGAGIGGGDKGSGGTITISGGLINATGGASGGAGIGGGDKGSGGTITISGGLINATGGASGGAGIGGGTNNTTTGTISALSGNAVVFASSIGLALPADKLAIVFIGTAGTMYGNVTLEQDVTIPADKNLTIGSGQTLTIPVGITLTNNGTITKNGGDITGTVSGDGAVND